MNKALETMKEKLRDKKARNENVQHICKKNSRGKGGENVHTFLGTFLWEHFWLRIFQN